MSKSTIVSIVPFPITEFKPGIYPGNFEIKGSKNNIPEILVISDSIYHVEIDENRTITVKCPSEDIAKSIIEDYVISNIAFDREEDAAPGIFWKAGVYDLGGVLGKLKEDLDIAKERQQRWFKKLVEMADDDWEKTRQHRSISDIQRYAAKWMNLERPWIISTIINTAPVVETVKCIACQSSISKEAIVCPQCRCILNMEKYKTIQFSEVK